MLQRPSSTGSGCDVQFLSMHIFVDPKEAKCQTSCVQPHPRACSETNTSSQDPGQNTAKLQELKHLPTA